MKAIIIDLRGGFAAAFSDDGSVVKLQNKNYTIGQVIELKQQTMIKTKNHKKWFASAICAASLICVLGTGVWAYTTPYSYVSLDVNPSIEYSLNRFQRVLSVKAVNDDGKEIVDEISAKNLTNIPIQEAIKNTVLQISEDGYFDGEEEGGIVITTSGENTEDAQKLAEELQEKVEETVDEETEEEVTVEAISVGLERVQEARKLGVTPGKLNLVEKLQASAGDSEAISVEEWLNKPVKEIMKAIKENRKAAKADLPDEKADSESEESTSSEESVSTTENTASESSSENAVSKSEKEEQKADQAASKAESQVQKDAQKQEAASSKASDKEASAIAKNTDKEAAASSRAEDKTAAESARAAEKEERESTKSSEKDSGSSADKSNNGQSGSNKGANK